MNGTVRGWVVMPAEARMLDPARTEWRIFTSLQAAERYAASSLRACKVEAVELRTRKLAAGVRERAKSVRV